MWSWLLNLALVLAHIVLFMNEQDMNPRLWGLEKTIMKALEWKDKTGSLFNSEDLNS